MSPAGAQLGMRVCVVVLVGLLASSACVSTAAPPAPALDVAAGPASSSPPSILERAQTGLLFADGGPEGAQPAVDPHAGHHMHHGHQAAPAVDAGSP